jgi:hypothetical protein
MTGSQNGTSRTELARKNCKDRTSRTIFSSRSRCLFLASRSPARKRAKSAGAHLWQNENSMRHFGGLFSSGLLGSPTLYSFFVQDTTEVICTLGSALSVMILCSVFPSWQLTFLYIKITQQKGLVKCKNNTIRLSAKKGQCHEIIFTLFFSSIISFLS